jgi:hypothetical protein
MIVKVEEFGSARDAGGLTMNPTRTARQLTRTISAR